MKQGLPVLLTQTDIFVVLNNRTKKGDYYRVDGDDDGDAATTVHHSGFFSMEVIHRFLLENKARGKREDSVCLSSFHASSSP